MKMNKFQENQLIKFIRSTQFNYFSNCKRGNYNFSSTLTSNWRKQRGFCAPEYTPLQWIPEAILHRIPQHMLLGTYQMSGLVSSNWTMDPVFLCVIEWSDSRAERNGDDKKCKEHFHVKEAESFILASDFLFTCRNYVEYTRLSLHSHLIAAPAQKRSIILQ